MNPSTRAPLDRRTELACDRALSGLDPREEAELASLMAAGEQADQSLELAAAAIVLAESVVVEPLPRHLAERVLASASQARAAPSSVVRGGTVPMIRPSAPLPAPRAAASPGGVGSVTPITAARGGDRRRLVPWLLAAACFGLAVGSFILRGPPRDDQARGTETDSSAAPGPKAPRASQQALTERKARLLAEAPDVVRVAWSSTEDPAGKSETGELVWSSARQEGFMTFRGLASNDPLKTQYQLWIFDGARDDRYPVDGGVFDVDASKGEVVIPITAKVRVSDPKLFAVTVEPPGGVVVSKRERIVVTAKVAS